MQAIVTKYLCPTNVRGSRVKATAQAGSVTIGWDDALDSDDNHQKAAQALCAKMKWSTRRGAHGVLPDGAHVWIPVPATLYLRNMLADGSGEGV